MGSFESFRRVDVYGFAMLMWETLRRCMTHDGVEVCCNHDYANDDDNHDDDNHDDDNDDGDNHDDDNGDVNMLMMWETLCGVEACCMQRELMMHDTMGFVEMIWIKLATRTTIK